LFVEVPLPLVRFPVITLIPQEQKLIRRTAKERSLEEAPVAKRAPSPGIDGVNLNMAEGQVAELTFVETRAVDELEDEE
jgi:hypothetical protein